ncbi:MAG: 50S ribosomal protein L18, partial [Pseudomonadota bacterium]
MATKSKTKNGARAGRTRAKIAKVANGRPRLSVFRSGKNIAAQVIDDATGKTLAA